ncbi:MAG TPA: pyrimidine dimer DNA glycosylase/endonuclease V, partial [Xanthomonadaceae bacterium]|nr:pyrimidine dimer DNA glycosylase/endonuclease V [Xanthomonadaceae bacterium]
MRLWTLHPHHLDARGLVALWREGLLARAVLCGQTKGYTRHPQLERFRLHATPLQAIDTYLAIVCDEADARGYRFDRSKLAPAPRGLRLPASDGQLAYEWGHLLAKL